MSLEEDKFTKCWACGTAVLNKRIEKHHIFGKQSQQTVDLCLICHDFVDRVFLDDIQIFQEYYKGIIQEAKQFKGKDIKYTKRFILKGLKCLKIKNDIRRTTF